MVSIWELKLQSWKQYVRGFCNYLQKIYIYFLNEENNILQSLNSIKILPGDKADAHEYLIILVLPKYNIIFCNNNKWWVENKWEIKSVLVGNQNILIYDLKFINTSFTRTNFYGVLTYT